MMCIVTKATEVGRAFDWVVFWLACSNLDKLRYIERDNDRSSLTFFQICQGKTTNKRFLCLAFRHTLRKNEFAWIWTFS